MFGGCAALALPSSHALLRHWRLGPSPRSTLLSSWAALSHRAAGQRTAVLQLRLMGSLGPNGAEPRSLALGAELLTVDDGTVKSDMFWGSATAAYQVCRHLET